MMANVLMRLSAPGQPLDRFFDEVLQFELLSRPINWKDIVVPLVSCFLMEQYREEKALTEVTRSSIETFAGEFLRSRFHSGLEDAQYAELTSRIVEMTVQGIEDQRSGASLSSSETGSSGSDAGDSQPPPKSRSTP